jgi:hypothetical protein
MEGWNPGEAWRRFRLEAEAARNYHLGYALYIAQTHRDRVLEILLPTLLYIRAVAILEDSLELWLDAKGHRLREPYRDDLNGRLTYMGDHGLLPDIDMLHGVRRERNRLAHEPVASCDWARLSNDVDVVERSLLALELVRPTPHLEYFCERSAMEESQEPGVKFTRQFIVGVKEEGRRALEFTWTQRFLDD